MRFTYSSFYKYRYCDIFKLSCRNWNHDIELSLPSTFDFGF